MGDSKKFPSCNAVFTMGPQTGFTAQLARLAVSAQRDPVEALWDEFAGARTSAQKLTCRQQAIETMMVERIGHPLAPIPLPDSDHVSAVGREYTQEGPGGDLDRMKLAKPEATSLKAHHARWSAADAELGYSAAVRAEGRAIHRTRELAERLWATPAVSLTGVVAKLDALLSEGAPSSEAQEFPWPQLRAIRADLETLRVVLPRTSGR